MRAKVQADKYGTWQDFQVITAQLIVPLSAGAVGLLTVLLVRRRQPASFCETMFFCHIFLYACILYVVHNSLYAG